MLRLTMLGSAGIGLIALAVILFLPKKNGDTRIVKDTLVDGAIAIDGQHVVAEASSRPKLQGPLQFDGKTAGEQRELALGIKFRWCPAGIFFMGSPATEIGRGIDEDLVQVTLTSGFWLGEAEVTQGQWKSLMQTEPWQGQQWVKEGLEYAASYISHGDAGNGKLGADSASEFCRRLTEQERKAGRLPVGWKYALPTEAQWEYACRAGTTTKYHFGDNDANLSDYAWWGGTAGDGNAKIERYGHQVGLKKPNAWGLRDMHGNLFEWCGDWYGERLPGGHDPSSGAFTGSPRVIRGGAWSSGARDCRSADRYVAAPDGRGYNLGFRVAVVPFSE